MSLQLSLQISGIYIALLALLIVALAMRVVMLRARYEVGIGQGKHLPLQLAIRTHANAIEYVPIALLLLIAVENTWQMASFTHGLGATLFLARVFHALGLSQSGGTTVPRFVGTLLTWLSIIVSAIAVLAYSILNAA